MTKPKFLTLLTLIVLFWFSLQPATDPDTGWHIATGRYILEQKSFPQTDPFSFSLPDHPYIAHSWGTDVLMYLVNQLAGPIGLSVFFAFLTTAFFALSFSTVQLQSSVLVHPFWLLIVAYPAIEIIGQRPQVITVIGLAWLLRFLTKPSKSKFIWQIPTLFLFWANLHGGVILGLAVFGLWLGLSAIIGLFSKSELLSFLKCFLLSGAITLLNPYTFHLFTFSWGMITNATSMVYNSDWLPLFSGRLGDDSLILRLAIVIGSLVAIFDQRKQSVLRILAVIFLVLAFKSLRYLVPLLSVILLLVLPTLQNLIATNRPSKWLIIGFSFLILSFNFSVLFDKTQVFCSRRPDCYARLADLPFGAVQYLQANHLSGRIFNFYTWGGYLSWQLPDSRVFIDGRMDNFFLGSASFLLEFVAIEEGHLGWYDRLMAYKPNIAIIPTAWQSQTAELNHQGWLTVYQDDQAIVLKTDSSFHPNTE